MSIFQTETELWKLDDQETLEHTHGQKRKQQKNGGDDGDSGRDKEICRLKEKCSRIADEKRQLQELHDTFVHFASRIVIIKDELTWKNQSLQKKLDALRAENNILKSTWKKFKAGGAVSDADGAVSEAGGAVSEAGGAVSKADGVVSEAGGAGDE